MKISKNSLMNAILTSSIFLICFVVGEFGFRALDDVPFSKFKNFPAEKIYNNWDHQKSVAHPILGWTFPRNPSNNPYGLMFHSVDPNYPDKQPLPQDEGKVIIAMGDSMTTGANAWHNWARQLELIVDVPVVNAGIGGYGIDQIYLRLMTVIDAFDVGAVVFSYIPDNLRRAEVSVFFGSPKPFFDVDENYELTLRNTPVPRYEPSGKHLGWFRKVFGYSYLVHKFALLVLGPEDWLILNGEHRVEHDLGQNVACAIFKKLEILQRERNIPVILLPLYGAGEMDDKSYPETIKKHQEALRCAAKTDLAIVDTHAPLEATFGGTEEGKETSLRTYWKYPEDPHFSDKGYRFAAEYLAKQQAGVFEELKKAQ